jgi:hypothetical protein
MTLTPAIKGQLTKAAQYPSPLRLRAVRKQFEKLMPPEQAKHAARKYLVENA